MSSDLASSSSSALPNPADDASFVSILAEHKYSYIDYIGNGGFAIVYRVKSMKYNETFVVKRILLSKSEEPYNEVNSMMRLNHPCIVRLYEYFADYEYLYLILEYCPKKSLKEYIEENGPLTIDQFKSITRQILLAVQFTHSKNVAHCDIKPANILLDVIGRPKLSDFGLSLSEVTQSSNITSFGGSRAFMAPEIVDKLPHDPMSSDIWALGITFYYLAVGYLPFDVTDKARLNLAIHNGMIQYPQYVDAELRYIIKEMLAKIPRKRLTASQILELPFYKVDEIVTNLNGLNTNRPRICFTRSKTMNASPLNRSSARLESAGMNAQNNMQKKQKEKIGITNSARTFGMKFGQKNKVQPKMSPTVQFNQMTFI